MEHKFAPNTEVLALIQVQPDKGARLEIDPELTATDLGYEVLIRNHLYDGMPDQPVCELYGKVSHGEYPFNVYRLADISEYVRECVSKIENNKARICELVSETSIVIPVKGLAAIVQAFQFPSLGF